MAKKSKFGSMKRFGTRYGRRNKEKVATLEQEYRFKHVCPYCNYEKLKRLVAGIWQCEKCGVKFAGKAYATPKKKKVKELAAAEEIEEVEETEDLEEDTEDKEEIAEGEEPESETEAEETDEGISEETDSEELYADDSEELMEEPEKEVAA